MTATAQRSGNVCQLPPLWDLSYKCCCGKSAVVNEAKLVASSPASCSLILSDPYKPRLLHCNSCKIQRKHSGSEQALPVRCALGFSALGSVSVTEGKREKRFKCVEGRCEGCTHRLPNPRSGPLRELCWSQRGAGRCEPTLGWSWLCLGLEMLVPRYGPSCTHLPTPRDPALTCLDPHGEGRQGAVCPRGCGSNCKTSTNKDGRDGKRDGTLTSSYCSLLQKVRAPLIHDLQERCASS